MLKNEGLRACQPYFLDEENTVSFLFSIPSSFHSQLLTAQKTTFSVPRQSLLHRKRLSMTRQNAAKYSAENIKEKKRKL
ncbi:MAG: hypothetical protein U0K35_08730 [Prevotella sp.]|nr:hypothetical protein [Prevotella sp.]